MRRGLRRRSKRLLFVDSGNLTFQYQRGGSLVFTPDRHQNNLADVLAFYVYMVIGYDYDSLYFRIQKYTDAKRGTKTNKRKR